MKLKNILATLLLALCALTATAQNNYTDATIRYFKSNGASFDNEDMRQGLILFGQLAISNNNAPDGITAEQLAERYIQTQMYKDMATIFVPYIIDEVKLEDLNALCDLLESPAGRLANAHVNDTEFDGGSASDMMAIIEKAMMDIVLGNEPKKVTIKTTDKRAKLLHEFLTTQPIEQVVDYYINKELNSIENDISDETRENITKYYHENLEAMFCNLYNDTLSDADLEFFAKMSKNPAYKKMMSVLGSIVDNPTQLGITIMTKYNNWIETLK